jgi:hypothetical protein
VDRQFNLLSHPFFYFLPFGQLELGIFLNLKETRYSSFAQEEN